MKKYILRVIFTVFMAAIVILPLLPKTEAEYAYADEIRWRCTTSDSGETVYAFFTTEGEICRLPSNKYRGTFQHDFSMNRQYAAVVSGCVSYNGGGELYRIDGEGCTLVADNVFHGLISDDGQKLAYIQLTGSEDYGSLYLYDHGRRAATLIDAEVCVSHNTARFAISPDGGTVVYCRAQGKDFTGMVWSEGKSVSLGKNVFPIAASDDMAHIYYAEPENQDDLNGKYSLYVQSGSKKSFLLQCRDHIPAYFNRDFTEIYVDNRSNVIAAGADSVHKLGYSPHYIAEPYVNFYYESQYNPYRTNIESYMRQDIDSYRQLRINNSGDLGVINDDYSYTFIVENGDYPWGCNYQFSTEDNSLLQLPYTTLYYRSGSEEIEVFEKVEHFTASPDLSEIYCETLNGELYYVNRESGESSFIANGATLAHFIPYSTEINTASWYSLYYIPGVFMDGKCYFTDTEKRNLYSSFKGGELREVFSVSEGYIQLCLFGDKILIIHNRPVDSEINACDYYLVDNGKAAPFAKDPHQIHFIGH